MATQTRSINRNTRRKDRMSKVYTTDADRAAAVLATIRNIEQQIQATELEQVGTGKKEDDQMGVNAAGDPVTYAKRRQELQAQKANVIKANESLMPIVDKLHARQVEQTRAALED